MISILPWCFLEMMVVSRVTVNQILKDLQLREYHSLISIRYDSSIMRIA